MTLIKKCPTQFNEIKMNSISCHQLIVNRCVVSRLVCLSLSHQRCSLASNMVSDLLLPQDSMCVLAWLYNLVCRAFWNRRMNFEFVCLRIKVVLDEFSESSWSVKKKLFGPGPGLGDPEIAFPETATWIYVVDFAICVVLPCQHGSNACAIAVQRNAKARDRAWTPKRCERPCEERDLKDTCIHCEAFYSMC